MTDKQKLEKYGQDQDKRIRRRNAASFVIMHKCTFERIEGKLMCFECDKAKNTTSERQASFRERRKAEGLVEMRVWIPEAGRDDVKAFCAKLREEIRELRLI